MKVETGDSIPEWDMPRVAPERMRTMAAILRDPNPVHWDRSAVAALGFGERTINQGPLGLSYMLNMLMEWAGPRCIRRVVMRFPEVVLDEDHVIAKGVVTAVRDVDGGREADCEIWLERAGEGRLLEGSAVVRIPEAG